MNLTSIREDMGSIPDLSGSGNWRCCELWRRSQTQLRSDIAVAEAQASSYSSDSTPSLGTSICRGCGPRKRPKDEEKKKPFKKKLSFFNMCN